jgi:hypothetical protein
MRRLHPQWLKHFTEYYGLIWQSNHGEFMSRYDQPKVTDLDIAALDLRGPVQTTDRGEYLQVTYRDLFKGAVSDPQINEALEEASHFAYELSRNSGKPVQLYFDAVINTMIDAKAGAADELIRASSATLRERLRMSQWET